MDKTTNPMLLIPVLGRLLIIAVVVLIPMSPWNYHRRRMRPRVARVTVYVWHEVERASRESNFPLRQRCSSAALSPRYLNDGF
jgi:hypothetical protein